MSDDKPSTSAPAPEQHEPSLTKGNSQRRRMSESFYRHRPDGKAVLLGQTWREWGQICGSFCLLYLFLAFFFTFLLNVVIMVQKDDYKYF